MAISLSALKIYTDIYTYVWIIYDYLHIYDKKPRGISDVVSQKHPSNWFVNSPQLELGEAKFPYINMLYSPP